MEKAYTKLLGTAARKRVVASEAEASQAAGKVRGGGETMAGMKIAALYDIHANLPALNAVLAEVRREQVDTVVIGGDVLPGPMPRETLAALRTLGFPARFIQGNGERAVLEHLSGGSLDYLPEAAKVIVRWNAEQLSDDEVAEISAWPKTLTVAHEHLGNVLFCHATPRNDSEIFTRLTADESLRPAFSGVGGAIVACGHTHMQFDRTLDGIRIVNAGSVGMPFGAPGAYWLLLESDVSLRVTHYDLARAAEAVRHSTYPQAQEFAERNILNTPSEEVMLQAFSKAELKS